MSRLSKLFAAACFSLSLAACGGSELAEESSSVDTLTRVEQAVEPVPACPVGQTVVYWDEAYGACGGCTVSRQPGQPMRKYAACSGNISGTKAMIGTYCSAGCAPL